MINKGFVKKINKTTLEDDEVQRIIEELMDTILTDDNLFSSIYEEMIKHPTGIDCCCRFEGSSDFTVEEKDSKKEKFYADVRIDITSKEC